MKLRAVGTLAAAGLVASLVSAAAVAQASETVDAHVAAAKAAAGEDHGYIFNSLCVAPADGPAAGAVDAAAPDPAVFHVEPVKVFDNLYFVGEKEYSAWAVTTSEGIILLDTIWDYSVADEIVGGLRKLGFDPAQIKYAVVTHGHRDHVGGAK